MEKQRTSNSKIKYFLLSILFAILFIFTALNIPTPITAYAEDDEATGGSTVKWDIDGSSDGYIYIPGRIYWGGSNTRTGILFYCVDNETGTVVDGTQKILYSNIIDDNGDRWMSMITSQSGSGRLANTSVDSLRPQYCSWLQISGDWTDGGSAFKAWLEGDSDITYGGRILTNAQRLVKQYAPSAFDKVNHNDYSVCFEGMYGMAMYIVKDGIDVVRSYGGTWAHRTYPDITDEEELAKLSIIKYFRTEKDFVEVLNRVGADMTQRYGATGTANYKWLQSCAKYFSTSEEHFGIPAASKAGQDVTNQEMLSTGWNFAVIEVSLPPIHTYWEAYGTPGNTEPPDPTAATDGDCIIRKLYYTEELASDGTVITEAKDYHSYKQEGTTNYIVIDTESDYVLEGWKASSTNRELNIKDNFYSISATQSGDSAEEIEINVDNGVKYVYLLFKKTEVNPNPSQPYDFQLQQSQITKRVTFLDGTGPANTSSLFTHNFTWTASAPTQTSCTSHGGNGHHLYCDTEWDEEPREASGTPGTPGYDAGSSGVRHSHSNSCYDTPCTSFTWTDNTTSLGITLDTSTINKAVVSKNNSITYNQPAVNTITTSNKYYKDNTSTRSGTSQNTQSISNFNYITILFRGQDHLTLADWKNGGAISYLTSLAYDSAYNFKSANIPQGTRKSGTEYNETFATRFINRSPDMSTTYKATVGSAGICSTTASSYRFDTSTALTINNIVVNDPVGFIFLHIFRTTDTYKIQS